MRKWPSTHYPVRWPIRAAHGPRKEYNRIDDLYQLFKQRQLELARAMLAGSAGATPQARFTSDLHDTFYGQREFSIVDLNGYELNFAQRLKT